MKPRIFVSTVSSEFRTARTKIEHVLEFLGYEVVQQDIFGTEGGDLRQVLREKIDSCEALVQLAGDGYGAEPPTVDPDYGRVSYTQFEFLYAQKEKKTYLLFAGAGCHKDNPIQKLDLPRAGETQRDPAAHHCELRELQSAYRSRLHAGGHLWHSPQDDTALENAVLKIRNDSEVLRKVYRDWQKNLTARLDTIEGSLVIDKARLRAHLFAASEKALAADLAEADAIEGNWQKRQILIDAAQAAHQQRLSRVHELAEEFAAIETGETASATLLEMLRILDEEGIDSALAYLASQSSHLLIKASTKAEVVRHELQLFLTGAQLAIANGQHEKAESLFLKILAPGIVSWPEARQEYWGYLVDTKGPRQHSHGTLSAARATYCTAIDQAALLALQYPQNTQRQRNISISNERIGDIAIQQGD